MPGMGGLMHVFREVPGWLWLVAGLIVGYIVLQINTEAFIALTNELAYKLQILSIPVSTLLYVYGTFHLRHPKHRMKGWEIIGGNIMADLIIWFWPHIFPVLVRHIPQFNAALDQFLARF